MKSRYTDLLEIWKALSYDGALACDMPISEHERDFSRVMTGLETRGLAFFTLDLPALDTLVTTLLEDGSVRFEGPLTARKSKADKRPRFLWGFWKLVCSPNGCLLEDPDASAIAALRQLSCFQKKREVECAPFRVENAIKEYHKNDAQIIPAALDWAADSLDLSSVPNFSGNFGIRPDRLGLTADASTGCYWEFLRRLDLVSGILVSDLGSFDAMSDNTPVDGMFRHGPGAVSNLKGGSYKYDFPSWSEKLEGVFPFDWCSGSQLGEYPPSRREYPSRLIAVPKTAKTPRLIAAEPVEHQFCQQKVLTWLDKAISRSLAGAFLDLHDQSASQHLVAESSLDRSLSTIDLSSASDLVSCRHVESLLRANHPLLEAAHASRTRYVRDDVLQSGFIKLRKFASMGSALTFPIESLLFLCIALASAGAHDRQSIKRLRGKVRVFGDDIMLPTSAHADACKYLAALGLKVNRTKSFARGYFRESCGADYWRGFDVTPVRPKTLISDTVRNKQGMIDLANNLHKKGWWHGAAKVLQLIPQSHKRNVLSYKRAVPGIFTFGAERIEKPRFDKHLHVNYVRVPTLIEVQERTAQDDSTSLREHFTRAYSPYRARELGVVQRATAKFAFVRVEVTPLTTSIRKIVV